MYTYITPLPTYIFHTDTHLHTQQITTDPDSQNRLREKMMEFVAAPVITFESAEQSLFGTAQNPITLESSSEEEGDITPAVSVAKVIPHTHTHTHTTQNNRPQKTTHNTHTHTHTHTHNTHTHTTRLRRNRNQYQMPAWRR